MRLRNALVLFQCILSIGLIAATLSVGHQLRFMRHKDLGFSAEQVLLIPLQDKAMREQSHIILKELEALPQVEVGCASWSPANHITTRGHARWPGKPDDVEMEIYLNTIDGRFLDLYSIPFLSGRGFSDESVTDRQGAYLLNESAVKALGWTHPLEREFSLWGRNPGPVVGVVKDFHFQSLHEPVKPMYFAYSPSNGLRFLSLRLHVQTWREGLKTVEKVLNRFPSSIPWAPYFMDRAFDAQYRDELRMEKLFRGMAVLAILIAILGLWGLTLFMAERRTKEMGIRQVLGAHPRQVFWLMGEGYLRWILLAGFLALPTVALLLSQWKQRFAYQAPAAWQVWVLAVVTPIAMTFVTVAYHTVVLQRKNPVQSLRNE
jgi:putative ABC transport system permease protein